MASLQLKRRRRRRTKRGSAMLVTIIIIGALLAGAATLTNMQVQSQRSQDLTKSNVSDWIVMFVHETVLAISAGSSGSAARR